MQILATDLDRTLLPNGHWEHDEHAIELFNRLTKQSEILLIYITGRNLALTEQAIQEYGVRHPDILCCDVGTSIKKYNDRQWQEEDGWIKHVRELSPGWDRTAIQQSIKGIDGIWEQGSAHQNIFKQSYYVVHDEKDRVLQEAERLVSGRYDEEMIYSYDSQSGNGLLDFLPKSANKKTALDYVSEAYNAHPDEVVFCGDSGNDIAALTAGYCGVLVKNADEQLLEGVGAARKANPALRVYHAKGGFMGLNGNYTSGVIEGAYHYGLFMD